METQGIAGASSSLIKSIPVTYNPFSELPGSAAADTDTEKRISTQVAFSRALMVLEGPMGTNNQVPDEKGLDFDDEWEDETEAIAPESDYAVADAVKLVHEIIASHRALDRDEEWGDVDLFLPERASPLIRRGENTGRIRRFLLGALREGLVLEDSLISVCADAEGTRNEEAERVLSLVVSELGAYVVDWGFTEEPTVDDPSVEKEYLLDDALEFIEHLSSRRSDPFTFYSRDIRGDLLDAQAEIFLGREMWEGGRAALAALARWPSGLSALYEITDDVILGTENSLTVKPATETAAYDESRFSAEPLPGEDDDDDQEIDRDTARFIAAIAGIRAAGRDEVRAVEALDLDCFPRYILSRLVNKAQLDSEGRSFSEAMQRYFAAREKMIVSNLRLALSVAKKYFRSGPLPDDLIQEANLGLIKAVERYDWRKGFRFSTYATWWIRQSVTRFIANTARVVRAPVHMQDLARRVLRERAEKEMRLGRSETEFETAVRLGQSLPKVRLILSTFEEPVYLDESGYESAGDALVAPELSDPAAIAERAALRSTLFRMLDDFDKRARDVIVLRFGLGGEDEMTLEEVGNRFDVTRERIRQIESKALKKLAHESRLSVLAPFIGGGHSTAEGLSPPKKMIPSVSVKLSEEHAVPESKSLITTFRTADHLSSQRVHYTPDKFWKGLLR